MHNFKLPLQST